MSYLTSRCLFWRVLYSRDFVVIGHFYTDPMYIISYVVSNDAAFQLYQMELEELTAENS